NSILGNIIDIANDDSMSSFTAVDALYEQSSDNLINAIQSAIANEITTSPLGNSFIFNGIIYTASEIASNITVLLPSSVSLLDDENAQIPNVALAYNGIYLTPGQ
ncbi:hypothetical protein IKS57_02330, partial [bacterium]|nr:hypothetical protein [bacterium]